MPDPTLFHGIAVVIDDEIYDPDANVGKIVKAIEEVGCHVIRFPGIPTETGISNLREVAFVILDWKLYGASLKEIEGQPVPPGIIEENEASIIKFLRDFKEVRFAPVFIFTDEPEDKILESLRRHADVYNEGDPTHILVKDKREILRTGVFNVLAKWMEANPSVYVLKEWEKAYEKAKNELFVDFYVKDPLWPLVLWKNFEVDSVPPDVQLGELIGRNLTSRMIPFSCDLSPFGDLLEGMKKDLGAYGKIVRKVLEGERFLPELRLDHDSFEPGDIFQVEDGYRINVRPDCDCIPRGHTKLGQLDLYLLKGSEQPVAELKHDRENGLILEQDNEAVIFPVYDGKALRFKFKNMDTQKWRDLKTRRVGRLLPPFLTRLQQRYSSYLQRPGLSRLPDAVFPSPAPPVEAEGATEAAAATPAAEPAPSNKWWYLNQLLRRLRSMGHLWRSRR
ncbi:MAG: hypothetical protein WAO35_10815 [Terriglobia bacterium]